MIELKLEEDHVMCGYMHAREEMTIYIYTLNKMRPCFFIILIMNSKLH